MQEKIVSVHVPKCAGTSLRGALARAYGDEFLPDYGSEVILADFRAVMKRKRQKARLLKNAKALDRKKVIHGHFYASKYADLDFPRHWITFVREPAELLVSYYSYLRRREASRRKGHLDAIARAITLEEFIEHPFFANVITRMTYPLAPTDFRFIGFTETYAGSLTALSKFLGKDLEELTRNTDKPGEKKTIDPAIRRKIERFNALDLEWYEQARKHAASLGLPAP